MYFNETYWYTLLLLVLILILITIYPYEKYIFKPYCLKAQVLLQDFSENRQFHEKLYCKHFALSWPYCAHIERKNLLNYKSIVHENRTIHRVSQTERNFFDKTYNQPISIFAKFLVPEPELESVVGRPSDLYENPRQKLASFYNKNNSAYLLYLQNWAVTLFTQDFFEANAITEKHYFYLKGSLARPIPFIKIIETPSFCVYRSPIFYTGSHSFWAERETKLFQNDKTRIGAYNLQPISVPILAFYNKKRATPKPSFSIKDYLKNTNISSLELLESFNSDDSFFSEGTLKDLASSSGVMRKNSSWDYISPHKDSKLELKYYTFKTITFASQKEMKYKYKKVVLYNWFANLALICLLLLLIDDFYQKIKKLSETNVKIIYYIFNCFKLELDKDTELLLMQLSSKASIMHLPINLVSRSAEAIKNLRAEVINFTHNFSL